MIDSYGARATSVPMNFTVYEPTVLNSSKKLGNMEDAWIDDLDQVYIYIYILAGELPLVFMNVGVCIHIQRIHACMYMCASCEAAHTLWRLIRDICTFIQATRNMSALGKHDQILLVSNIVAWSLDEASGGQGNAACRKLLTTGAYRTRTRKLLLRKLGVDKDKLISSKTATSVLATTGNLILRPAELAIESTMDASELLLASMNAVLPRDLREKDSIYLYKVYCLLNSLAEAAMMSGSQYAVTKVVTTALHAALRGSQKYLDTMQISEGMYRFPGSNFGCMLQRRLPWEGAADIQSPKETFDVSVTLSDDYFFTQGRRSVRWTHTVRQASLRVESAWADGSLALITMYITPWYRGEQLILSDHAIGIVILTPFTDISAITYPEKETQKQRGTMHGPSEHSAASFQDNSIKAATLLAWKAKSTCKSQFGACIDVKLRVSLSSPGQLKNLDVGCKRWNGTSWSGKFCSFKNVTLHPPPANPSFTDQKSSTTSKGYAIVHCKCTRDGIYIAVQEDMSGKRKNKTVDYYLPAAKYGNMQAVSFAWIACLSMLAYGLVWVLFCRAYFKMSFMESELFSWSRFSWSRAMEDCEEYILRKSFKTPRTARLKDISAYVRNQLLCLYHSSHAWCC